MIGSTMIPCSTGRANKMTEAKAREIKGWHVLAFTVAAFGVIIAVNLVIVF